MKTVIYLFVFVAILCWVGDLKVTFNPFTVKFESGAVVIGWLLIAIGIVFVGYNAHKKSYNEGYQEAFNDAVEVIQGLDPKEVRESEKSVSEVMMDEVTDRLQKDQPTTR